MLSCSQDWDRHQELWKSKRLLFFIFRNRGHCPQSSKEKDQSETYIIHPWINVYQCIHLRVMQWSTKRYIKIVIEFCNSTLWSGVWYIYVPDMMTSSNGNIFCVTLALSAGNSPVTGEFPSRRSMARSFDVFFDLRLNKRLINNREAGDLRRHRAHYDVTVMENWTCQS